MSKTAQKGTKQQLQGPNFYEVEFLRQMKEELEVFLKSKNFSTIEAFQINFIGKGYNGAISVRA